MDSLFEDGNITVNGKAAVLGSLIKTFAVAMEPVAFDSVFDGILKEFDQKEEVIAGAIYASTFYLERQGIIRLSTCQSIQKGTSVLPTRKTTDLIWDDVPLWDEDEDA